MYANTQHIRLTRCTCYVVETYQSKNNVLIKKMRII